MKTNFSIFASTALLFAAAWTSPGYIKNEPADVANISVTKIQGAGFSFFRTHRQGKGITASWGTNSFAGVVSFSGQKTYEDPTDPYAFWEEVCSTPCNGSRSYKFTDNNVFPGFISYQVTALMSDGSTIKSGISTVHIVSR